MPEYGSKEYWNARYERVDEPFDWMVDYSALAPTLQALIIDKNLSILLVGCGDAPFSADLFYLGGYQNQVSILGFGIADQYADRPRLMFNSIQVNADYSEIVIEKQKKLWPEIQWRVLDCLDMKEVTDGTFGKLGYDDLY
jgi:hypothetical protein